MKLHGLFAIYLLGFLGGFAQENVSQAFREIGGWHYVSSDNFDVYYNRGHQVSATRVARYAEIARYELGILYDYKPEDRFILIYSSNEFEFQHTNFIPPNINNRVSGVVNLPQSEGFIVDPGNAKELFAEVKKQVSTLILNEFAHGNRLGSVLQNHILSHNPQWFVEGLSEYVAKGWSFEDEMWIHSIKNEDILNMVLEGDDQINRVLRKSIWHYIIYEYGEQKLSEIIYLVNIAHSIESGVISVLGITLNTLTQRWREFTLSQASNQMKGETEIKQLPEIYDVPLKSGYQLSSFAYNEQQNLLAIYLNKEGNHQVFLYDLAKEQYISTSIKSGLSTTEKNQLSFAPPMAWSHDGKQLATIAYKHPYLELIYYDLQARKAEHIPLDMSIQKINSFAWSHDGERLAISALVDGQVDLFTTSTTEADLKPVTRDVYDELDPSWSLDDQYIFFSSNRNSRGQEDEVWESYGDNLDLFYYEHAKKKFNRLTNTPKINERHPYAINSFAINYISDASGIHNVYNLNLFKKETKPVSNLAQGIDGVSGTENFLAFSTAMSGYQQLFVLKNEHLQAVKSPSFTRLRTDYDAQFKIQQDRKNKEKEQIAQQTPPRQKDKPQPETPPDQEKNETENEAKKEAENEDDPPVRYYLFDEGDEPYEVKKPEKRLFNELEENTRLVNSVFGEQPKPKWEELHVSSELPVGMRWVTDYLKLDFGYDPIAKYGMDIGIGFSDVLKHHKLEVEISPYINLRNGDAKLRYTYTKGRVDLYGEAAYSFRHYRRNNFRAGGDSLIFRYDQSYLMLGGLYPFTSSFSAGLEANVRLLNRKDLKLLRADLLDAKDQMMSATAYLQFDNTRKHEAYQYKGVKARLAMNSYYSINQQDFSFHTIKLDVNNYLEVYDKLVLATRLRGGLSFGNNEQQFYMGGIDDWLVGVFFENDVKRPLKETTINPDLYAFQFQEFLSPIHGFGFSTREGTKYVMANMELRIPLSRLLKRTLNSSHLYKFELIPFFDAGTVWRQGNPFSQKNPTDTQIIGSPPITVELQTLKSPFLFGFGTGFRVLMIGYSIRTDIGWGIDDNALNAPIFSVSIGRSF